MSDSKPETDCGNDGCDERARASRDVDERWRPDAGSLDGKLPRDVQAGLGRVLGREPVETLAEWVAEVRDRTGGGSLAVEDLCHTDDRTAHWGRMDGETYHFQCFYDAVILSAMADQPVDIHTESPDGTTIEARAAGTSELRVAPETAVFSVGVGDGVAPPDDGAPTPADIYGAVCPYVRAFPDRDAYERWAETVPAATVAVPLSGATDVAAALVA